VEKHKLMERVLFSSFYPRALQRAHLLLPSVPLGLLTLPKIAGALMRSRVGSWLVPYQALHPEKSDVTARLVAGTHRRGQRLHVWTVNEPADMQRLFSLNVDGIFTDDPRLARQILSSAGRKQQATAH